jgi:ubiquinone/menaquinone biosynthesis C-methylase UbiE/acyl carrier protein
LNQASGSYILESFSENRNSEVTRLKYQVDLFYRKEVELYKKIGLRDGMAVIECGSGPGFLIKNLISDFPDCTATAVEIDPFLVSILNKNSVIDGKKLFEVKHSSIYKTELPDNSFDFAIARLVLEHLQEPEKAIAEVRRILKPGGKFVIVSNDFAYHLLTFPILPDLDEMYRAYIMSRIREGGNPLIGRQLPVLLRRGRFNEINVDIICVHSDLEGDATFLKSENVNISKSLVKDGFLKKETLESLIQNWYKMLQDPDHVIFRQLFVISGMKNNIMAEGIVVPAENEPAFKKGNSLSFDELKVLNISEQEERLSSYFISLLKKIMEHQNMDINLDTELIDFDIDSISAAELSSILKSDFKTNIRISDILQKVSIRDIINLVLKNLKSDSNEKTEDLESASENKWLEGTI